MKKWFLWQLILCTSILASASAPLPYGITLNEKTNELMHETNITIYQNGKELIVLQSYRINEIHRGDINGDGYAELVFHSYTGGAHCCNEYTIIELRPDISEPYIFNTGSGDITFLKDTTRDKKLRFEMWDDKYSYMLNLCFACSPAPKVVAYYDKRKLNLNVERTKILREKEELKLTRSRVVYDKKEKPNFIEKALYPDGQANLKFDNPSVAFYTIEEILHQLYVGNKQKAVFIMQKYFDFEHPSLRKVFLYDLTKRMSNSLFWDDIRIRNGWGYDHEVVALMLDRLGDNINSKMLRK